jgi:hypothetical protein
MMVLLDQLIRVVIEGPGFYMQAVSIYVNLYCS